MDAMFNVIILDLDSDTPGVEWSFGPFDKDEADAVVRRIENATELRRGYEIQVPMTQPFDHEFFDPCLF